MSDRDRSAARLTWWPFVLVDVVFLGLAWLIFKYGHRPLTLPEVYGIILCTAIGAWSFLRPFQTKLRIEEAQHFTSTVEKIKNLEQVAAQISSATNLWNAVQEESAKTAEAARQVARQMTDEAKAFSDFLAKANDTEKGHLRLEADKLRRSQEEWLQVLVRIMDHVYALHQGAVQSGNRRLAEQIGQFRHACHDAARRVGLVPVEAVSGEAFNPERHQLREGQSGTEGPVLGTLACGYQFQGALVRPALVQLGSPQRDMATREASAAAEIS